MPTSSPMLNFVRGQRQPIRHTPIILAGFLSHYLLHHPLKSFCDPKPFFYPRRQWFALDERAKQLLVYGLASHTQERIFLTHRVTVLPNDS